MLEQFKIMSRGAVETIALDSLAPRFNRALIVKAGFDPTAPDLHFGHLVLLTKMRQLQDLGHKIFFLIGDFTGLIGDPSGKNTTRPILTEEQVNINANTYKQQVFKVLDESKTTVCFNSLWLNELGSAGMLKLSSAYTIARMLERDDFSKRYKEGKPISIHEFFYPLLQGYDSVALNADIELGGIDQKFNLLMGRELQKFYDVPLQAIIMMPLLIGLDGVKKMSKSLNNYIALNDAPNDMFGKIMSTSDSLMWHYYELLSSSSLETIADLKNKTLSNSLNPKNCKIELALEMVTRFYNKDIAADSLNYFNSIHIKHDIPTDLPIINVLSNNLVAVIKELEFANSTSLAMRLIKEGGVKLNNIKVVEKNLNLNLNEEYLIQVGKRKFAKVIVVEKHENLTI